VEIREKAVYVIGVVAVITISVVSWYTFQDRHGNKQASAVATTLPASTVVTTFPAASAIREASTAAPEPAKWMFISSEQIKLLKTKVSNGEVNNNAELLGHVYRYGISVSQDKNLADKYYLIAEQYAKSNNYRNSIYNLAIDRFLLNSEYGNQQQSINSDFVKQLEAEFIERSNFSCNNQTDKQKRLACTLSYVNSIGELNTLAVEWVKKQGADFSNAAYAEVLSERISKFSEPGEVDAWLRLIDYGLDPNITENDKYFKIKKTLLEQSINCNENFADFRLAAKLIEAGADPNKGTYGPIAELIKNCPDLELTNSLIKAMIDKGLDKNRVITIDRLKPKITISEAIVNSGSLKLAGLFATAGGNINLSAIQEKQEKITSLDQRAKAGDIDAMVMLGSMYLNGEGVPKNKTLASPYIKKAAQAGNAKAQWYMTWLDDIPSGEHLSWITKSAEQGFPPAEFQLGQAYENGGQMEKAKYWYRRSEKHGMSMGGSSVAQIDRKQDEEAIKGSSAVCQGYRDQMNALRSGDRLVESYQRQKILDSAQKYGCL